MKEEGHIIAVRQITVLQHMRLSYTIRRITRLARPSVPHGPVTRKRRKIKIVINVPQGTNKWRVNLQVTGCQKPPEIAAYLAYVFTCGRRIKRRRLRRRLQTRPNPFLDVIYCQRLRCSVTGRTAAYHVGTRQLFLLSSYSTHQITLYRIY